MSTTGVLIITGTGTGIGKTLVTAAVAVVARGAGLDVAVVKPVQTGVQGDEPGDVHEVARRAGAVAVHELARLGPPLAPDTAARLGAETLPDVREHARVVAGLADRHDLVLVEGAGGLLVRLDLTGGTVADLAAACSAGACSAGGGSAGGGSAGGRPVPGVLVVVRAGLGTLNEAELTVEALRARRLPVLGLVIGRWPATPGLAERCNLADLPRVTGVPLLGTLPDGAGALDPESFRAAAPRWLAPALLDDAGKSVFSRSGAPPMGD